MLSYAYTATPLIRKEVGPGHNLFFGASAKWEGSVPENSMSSKPLQPERLPRTKARLVKHTATNVACQIVL